MGLNVLYRIWDIWYEDNLDSKIIFSSIFKFGNYSSMKIIKEIKNGINEIFLKGN